MARVTVEDCVDKVSNRFDLVLFAAQRAREISGGAELTIERDRDKNPVVALREIAEITCRVAGPGACFTTREFPADRKSIDIGSYHADDRAFRSATGWAPLVGLEDGIGRSLDWYRSRLAAYL